jgi:transcription-repair coupling factor (superfamily II helicase)
MKQDSALIIEKYKGSQQLIDLKNSISNRQGYTQTKGLSGSSLAFISSAIFTETEDLQLFMFQDKEEAVYFFNTLENINSGDKKKKFYFYPASYKRPYQIESTDNANVLLRTEVLNAISKNRKNSVVVSYPEAMVEKVITKKSLLKSTLEIHVGDNYSIDFLNELFIESHFHKVDYVYEPGQFSVRGGIVDVFSFAFDYPFRIEFFGDEVDSIRSFNIADQLSINTHKKITITPNVQAELLEESRTSFFEFISKKSIIWLHSFSVAKKKIEQGFDKALYSYNQIESELKRLPPNDLYINSVNFEKELNEFTGVEFGNEVYFSKESVVFHQSPQPSFNKKFDLLAQNLKENSQAEYENFLFSDNPNQIQRLEDIFDDIEKEAEFIPIHTSIKEGFVDNDLQIVCYTDHQIFERYHKFKLKEGYKQSKEAVSLKEIYGLKKGDFIVHIDHGVGTFSGLEKIDVNGKEQEAIRLLYDGGDVLYVSIHSLHRISKFSSKDSKKPKINKLGTPAWKVLKAKTKQRVKEVAFDLIQLYAKRKMKLGFAYSPDTYLQHELEASFMYEDTPDQHKATLAVKEDMEKEIPMDRLVCGDVGFGKTEIAIRAAFKAVADSKQVAILVPTTILSLQHYRSFNERLKEFPCKVDYLNRFKSAKKVKDTLERLEKGEIDILIGTHKLTGKSVKFKDLGLLIVDEEQKFGVGVKDKLKTMKENVDSLTLTATPIPRTLQFSLMGARDLSVINTPPPNRQPIDTQIHTFNEELIRNAISYEMQRGGQAYFVNNRVQNIKEVAGMIQRLVPDAKVAIIHGQMEGQKMEATLMDFINGMYDVLVATSIIESGIDVPNANTMIINNANNFGLSDLHQMRGRIGRSNKKAFCYLITPPRHMLSDDATKRLNAIEQHSELGSGFNIAMKDLDIRGAGDLLGASQSGYINDIGFVTYQKILNETIEELKSNEFKELFKDEKNDKFYEIEDFQIETDLELLIPDTYVNQIAERLSLYQNLDEVKTIEELEAFRKNLKDRFGEVPEETSELLKTIRLKWLAKEVGFEKIILKQEKMICYFPSNQKSAYFESDAFTNVLIYIQSNPKNCKMSERNNKLRLIYSDILSISEAIGEIRKIKTS